MEGWSSICEKFMMTKVVGNWKPAGQIDKVELPNSEVLLLVDPLFMDHHHHHWHICHHYCHHSHHHDVGHLLTALYGDGEDGMTPTACLVHMS